MKPSATIYDLLDWLETHLDQPLSLDQVAIQSGYSKWHLQRKFKDTTGQVLGTYIRARRLSQAAIALRMTSQPLATIAQLYGFESQSAFNRAFKQQFSLTPALYRRSMKWDFFGFQPPWRSADYRLPEGKFVTLPEISLAGITQSYTCSLEQVSQCRSRLREHFWRRFLDEAQSSPPVLYGLCYSGPASAKNGENKVCYTAAMETEYMSAPLANSQVHRLSEGAYAQFTYHGAADGFQRFILDLYCNCLPLLQVVRREGCDIERYHEWPSASACGAPGRLLCEYLIPVVR